MGLSRSLPDSSRHLLSSFLHLFHPARSSNSTQFIFTELEITRLIPLSLGCLILIAEPALIVLVAIAGLFHVKVEKKHLRSCSIWSLTLLSTTPRWLTTCALSLLLVSVAWRLCFHDYMWSRVTRNHGTAVEIGRWTNERKKQ